MLKEFGGSMLFYGILFFATKKYAKLPMKRTENGYKSLDKQASTRTIGFYVSLVHGMIVSFLMFYGYFEYEHDPERPMYYLEEVAFSHSLGYMVYDMFVHYFNNTLNLFVFWHHVAAAFMFIALMMYPKLVYMVGFIVGASEITNPCHVVKTVLDLSNYETNSKLYALNFFAFGIPFLVFRAILSTKLYYHGFTYKQGPIFLKIIAIASHSLFIDWSIQVCFLLWKMFPYLFNNSKEIEKSIIWRSGRELTLKLSNDAKYSTYFKIVEFSLTIALPLVISISYSSYDIYQY